MKPIYLTLAFASLALGAAGILLPILPTTPFMLVASFCFAKGSERANQWFLSTKLYKKYFCALATERALLLRTKICVLLLASTMLMGAFFAVDSLYFRAFIMLLILVKYYYFLFKIKTKK